VEEFVRCEIISSRSIGGINGLYKVYARCESSTYYGLQYDVLLVVKGGEVVRASCSCPVWASNGTCEHVEVVIGCLGGRRGGVGDGQS
jgi:hypothetical protein